MQNNYPTHFFNKLLLPFASSSSSLSTSSTMGGSNDFGLTLGSKYSKQYESLKLSSRNRTTMTWTVKAHPSMPGNGVFRWMQDLRHVSLNFRSIFEEPCRPGVAENYLRLTIDPFSKNCTCVAILAYHIPKLRAVSGYVVTPNMCQELCWR